MSVFPGRIFDGEGTPMDGKKADLTQEELDACQHRSTVQVGRENQSVDGVAPVAWIWLTDDTATFSAIAPALVSSAIKLMLDGQAILILSRPPEVGADIRDGLLGALELAQTPDDAAGHA